MATPQPVRSRDHLLGQFDVPECESIPDSVSDQAGHRFSGIPDTEDVGGRGGALRTAIIRASSCPAPGSASGLGAPGGGLLLQFQANFTTAGTISINETSITKDRVLVFIDGFACDYHLMMPRKSQQAYLEWKLADAQAQRKEKELDACWDEYFARRGPPPPEELFQEKCTLCALT